jgi:primosomal protein N''
MEELSERSRAAHSVDNLVAQIEALNKFVSNERFREFQAKTGEGLESTKRLRDELGRFVENDHFNEFREETVGNLRTAHERIDGISEHAKEVDRQISCIDGKATKASEEAEQNTNMVKEINFAEMQQRLKKFRDDTETRLGEMALKLKRKVGAAELSEVEKNIVERLDGFLAGNDPKADRQ